MEGGSWSTTPHKDGPILDVVRVISGRKHNITSNILIHRLLHISLPMVGEVWAWGRNEVECLSKAKTRWGENPVSGRFMHSCILTQRGSLLIISASAAPRTEKWHRLPWNLHVLIKTIELLHRKKVINRSRFQGNSGATVRTCWLVFSTAYGSTYQALKTADDALTLQYKHYTMTCISNSRYSLCLFVSLLNV